MQKQDNEDRNVSILVKVQDAIRDNEKRQASLLEIVERVRMPKATVAGALKVSILRGIILRYPLRKYCDGRSAIVFRLVGNPLERKHRADIFRLLAEKPRSFSVLMSEMMLPHFSMAEVMLKLVTSEGVVKSMLEFKDITLDTFCVRNFKLE